MGNIKKESGGLAWLSAALCEQRDIVASLMRRLTCLGTSKGVKPSVFRKFMKTLEQISIEKEIETDIIGRIQAVENLHRMQRGNKNLRLAEPSSKLRKNAIPEVACEQEQDRSGDSWLFIMGLLGLMGRHGPKPQE